MKRGNNCLISLTALVCCLQVLVPLYGEVDNLLVSVLATAEFIGLAEIKQNADGEFYYEITRLIRGRIDDLKEFAFVKAYRRYPNLLGQRQLLYYKRDPRTGREDIGAIAVVGDKVVLREDAASGPPRQVQISIDEILTYLSKRSVDLKH